jgi:hypothetical protein
MSVVVLHRKFFHTQQLQSLAHTETFLCWFQTSAAAAAAEEQQQQVQEQEAATTTAAEELGYGESVIREWRLSRGHGDHGSVSGGNFNLLTVSHQTTLTNFLLFSGFWFCPPVQLQICHRSSPFIHSYTVKDTRLGIKGLVDTFTHTISELLFSNKFCCLIVCLFARQ